MRHVANKMFSHYFPSNKDLKEWGETRRAANKERGGENEVGGCRRVNLLPTLAHTSDLYSSMANYYTIVWDDGVRETAPRLVVRRINGLMRAGAINNSIRWAFDDVYTLNLRSRRWRRNDRGVMLWDGSQFTIIGAFTEKMHGNNRGGRPPAADTYMGMLDRLR